MEKSLELEKNCCGVGRCPAACKRHGLGSFLGDCTVWEMDGREVERSSFQVASGNDEDLHLSELAVTMHMLAFLQEVPIEGMGVVEQSPAAAVEGVAYLEGEKVAHCAAGDARR